MSNILKYKGYFTKIECNIEDNVLFGKIEGIADLIMFECSSLQEAEKEFHNTVDDYLEFCKEVGKIPDKPYNGCFNVRINAELHKELSMYACNKGVSLNKAVEQAIFSYLHNDFTASSAVTNHEDISCSINRLWGSSKIKYLPSMCVGRA